MKGKKRKGFITSVADPLSDDDFDLEVKASAKEYAEVQRQIARRERVRQENKERKKRGEAILPLPRVPLPKNRIGHVGNGGGGRGGSTPGVSGDEDADEDDVVDGSGTPKKQRLANDDELGYEGQVILPFDPLYVLAGEGLPDPNGKDNPKAIAHQKLVSRLMGQKPAPSGSSSRFITPASGPEKRPPAVDGSLTRNKSNPPSSDTVDDRGTSDFVDEEEEAPEGDYEDEDDVVVVPWGEMVRSDDIVDDGIYSDEELFAGVQPDITAEVQSIPKVDQDDIPPYRPMFSFTSEQADIGPYFLDANTKDIAIPASINRFLKTYQQVGAQFMYDHYKDGIGGVLGDDMGLGKTIQVIAFLSAIMRKTGTAADDQRRKKLVRQSVTPLNPRHWPTALIVCPKSLVANWSRELDTWGYFEYAVWRSDNFEDIRSSFFQGFLDIVLTSYDTARTTISQLKDLPLSVVIADEAHRMKEPRAQSSLALKQIHCRTCFALTGTLVQNRMDEMWSVLDFAHRGWAGTLKQWRAFAVNPIKKGHRSQGTTEEVVSAIMRLGVMNQRVLPHFYLRRDKRLIAHELPEKRDMVVFCPLAKRQITAYQALIDSEDVQFLLKRNDPCSCGSGEKTACCHGETNQGETVKDVLLKNISALQKVANHFGLLYHAKDDSQHTREINRHFFRICTGQDYDTKQHNVVQAALDPENCGKWTLLEQLLIQWRREPTKNKVSGFAFDMLTGEAGNAERMDMVDRFQDDSQDNFILLISTLAGGVGLNLTAKRTVDVYRLIAQGTLEELKYERQIHKQQRARQLNDGTFEPRIHQGFDGARNAEDQGELFGAHNIFRFNPKGFVSNNLERVRLAEDQFVQDLIQAEFNDSENEDEESDDGARRKMRDERRARELNKARQKRAVSQTEQKVERRQDDLVNDILGDAETPGSPKRKKEEDVLSRLGVTTHMHEAAFRDSPEERAIYEIGVQVLRNNPAMAKKIKANDLGKLGRTIKSSSARRDRPSAGGAAEENEEEPWQRRIQERKKEGNAERVNKVLAELSD
ncbi:hypothetical protein CI109_103132 [Kwoniella shandongensis]|uniref:Helicase ATP-binding domain-containing protein n=1 Tax=Kwoniella shandongensis TaxID=1734106 RepID=A0AAJ8LHH2_9TREE